MLWNCPQPIAAIRWSKLFTLTIRTDPFLRFDEWRNCQIFPTRFPGVRFVFIRRQGLYLLRNNSLELFNTREPRLDRLVLTSKYDVERNQFYTSHGDTFLCIRPDTVLRFPWKIKIRISGFIVLNTTNKEHLFCGYPSVSSGLASKQIT
ncbi:MAG: hypothetical protein HWD58_08620 [Bacteroidota bacterium]|nr:MAG: hypothetical protein HWD58_08620 [Bacteroidota bacterium]